MKLALSTQDALHLVRLPATFVVWSNILAAHLIATGGWPHWLVLIPQLAAGTALCWSGVVLKDCFPLRQGATGEPAGLLASGRISGQAAWVLGGGLMVLGLAFAALAGGASLRIAVALGLAIVAYHGFLKDTLLGPVIMGAIHYIQWMFGLAVMAMGSGAKALAVPVFLYVAALTVLVGAEAKGAAPQTTRIAAVLLGLAALVIVELVLAGRMEQPLILALVVPAVLALGYWLWRLTADGSPAAVQTLVQRLTFGLIPLDALLLAGSGHWLVAPFLLLLLVPGFVFRSSPE
ncbi:hypothetical protein [uncultured Lamprocystis sp.]|jgi:4-hydroxybenzoate polyprenyltransferase|uniref:hypothetical protein n=1 Tax=uncultured Lamprocystis sp. TaxID=543132 RepID=UPI0025EA05E1|nr:hypothetical protein [uncultured Lamprocystis sp.]